MLVGRSFAPAALAAAPTNQVACFTPEQLEARLFDFSPLLAKLRADFEQSTLAHTYVEQYLTVEKTQATERSSAVRSKATKRDDSTALLELGVAWSRGQGKALWVLLGDYGTGKSAFTQRLAYELAKQCETSSEAPIPLLINLRDYANRTSLEAVIDEQIGRAHV